MSSRGSYSSFYFEGRPALFLCSRAFNHVPLCRSDVVSRRPISARAESCCLWAASALAPVSRRNLPCWAPDRQLTGTAGKTNRLYLPAARCFLHVLDIINVATVTEPELCSFRRFLWMLTSTVAKVDWFVYSVVSWTGKQCFSARLVCRCGLSYLACM